MRHVARLHSKLGLRIDRTARRDELPQGRSGIAGREQRPIVATPDALDQHVKLGVEPNRNTLVGNSRPRCGIEVRAAAGGEDLRPPIEQTGDHARFAGAEVRFAVGRKNVGDRHAGRLLDLGIRIDDFFAVNHSLNPESSMRCGMLRSDIQNLRMR